MMTNKVRIHPRSFVSTPCEHINIPPKKLYQLFFLLRRQLGADLKKNFRIIIYTTFSKSSHFTPSAISSTGDTGVLNCYKPLSIKVEDPISG